MNPTAAAPDAWGEVMAGLTGLRLAVHDELLRVGSLDIARIAQHLGGDGATGAALGEKLAEAVDWLAQHRLLAAHDGAWRAVHPGLARVQFEMSGLAAVAAPRQERGEGVGPAREQTAAVHRHQKEFFLMDGYREANGTM